MNLEPPFYRCVAPLTRPICKNLPKRFVSQPQLPKCIFNSEMKPFVSQGLLENPKEKTTFLSKKLEGSNLIHLIPWKLLPFIKEGNEIQSIKIKYVIVFKNQVKSIILQDFRPIKIKTFKNESIKRENVQMGHFWWFSNIVMADCISWCLRFLDWQGRPLDPNHILSTRLGCPSLSTKVIRDLLVTLNEHIKVDFLDELVDTFPMPSFAFWLTQFS